MQTDIEGSLQYRYIAYLIKTIYNWINFALFQKTARKNKKKVWPLHSLLMTIKTISTLRVKITLEIRILKAYPGSTWNLFKHLRPSFLAKIVNGFQQFTILAKKSYIVDVRLGCKNASDTSGPEIALTCMWSFLFLSFLFCTFVYYTLYYYWFYMLQNTQQHGDHIYSKFKSQDIPGLSRAFFYFSRTTERKIQEHFQGIELKNSNIKEIPGPKLINRIEYNSTL